MVTSNNLFSFKKNFFSIFFFFFSENIYKLNIKSLGSIVKEPWIWVLNFCLCSEIWGELLNSTMRTDKTMHIKYSLVIHSIFSTQYLLLNFLTQAFYQWELPGFISLVVKRIFKAFGFENYNLGYIYITLYTLTLYIYIYIHITLYTITLYTFMLTVNCPIIYHNVPWIII